MTVIRKNWISYFELPVITDSALSVHGTVMLQNWDALDDFVNIILKAVDEFAWTQSNKNLF